ncbi:hypothetical protein M404DRAFT_1002717, partial [Pisolithus tinctorius Marx 270]
ISKNEEAGNLKLIVLVQSITNLTNTGCSLYSKPCLGECLDSNATDIFPMFSLI